MADNFLWVHPDLTGGLAVEIDYIDGAGAFVDANNVMTDVGNGSYSHDVPLTLPEGYYIARAHLNASTAELGSWGFYWSGTQFTNTLQQTVGNVELVVSNPNGVTITLNPSDRLPYPHHEWAYKNGDWERDYTISKTGFDFTVVTDVIMEIRDSLNSDPPIATPTMSLLSGSIGELTFKMKLAFSVLALVTDEVGYFDILVEFGGGTGYVPYLRGRFEFREGVTAIP